MLQAVIFDFDGVIADSEELHYKALNAVFGRYGVDVPKSVHWEKYLGYTDQENIEAVSRDYGMGLDAGGVKRVMAEKKALFEEMARREAVIIEGGGGVRPAAGGLGGADGDLFGGAAERY